MLRPALVAAEGLTEWTAHLWVGVEVVASAGPQLSSSAVDAVQGPEAVPTRPVASAFPLHSRTDDVCDRQGILAGLVADAHLPGLGASR